jgi:hypothetical protein
MLMKLALVGQPFFFIQRTPIQDFADRRHFYVIHCIAPRKEPLNCINNKTSWIIRPIHCGDCIPYTTVWPVYHWNRRVLPAAFISFRTIFRSMGVLNSSSRTLHLSATHIALLPCLVIYKNCFVCHACLLAQLEIRVKGVAGSIFNQNLGGAFYFLAHDSGPNARLTSRVTDQIRSSAFQILFSIQATLICLEVEKTLIKPCRLLKIFHNPYQTHAVTSRFRVPFGLHTWPKICLFVIPKQ